jgi:dihydropteroate synthase
LPGYQAGGESGIKDLIIDPGFGFRQSKVFILNHLYNSASLICPFLRTFPKSMLYKSLDITAEEALNATTAANMVALMGKSLLGFRRD